MSVQNITSIPKINQATKQWAKLTRSKLILKLKTLSFKDRLHLEKELRLRHAKNTKSRVKIKDALASGILFSFPYQGWFVEHGTRKGVKKRDPAANPRPWISDVIPPAIENLADELVKNYGDLTIEEIQSTLLEK